MFAGERHGGGAQAKDPAAGREQKLLVAKKYHLMASAGRYSGAISPA